MDLHQPRLTYKSNKVGKSPEGTSQLQLQGLASSNTKHNVRIEKAFYFDYLFCHVPAQLTFSVARPEHPSRM